MLNHSKPLLAGILLASSLIWVGCERRADSDEPARVCPSETPDTCPEVFDPVSDCMSKCDSVCGDDDACQTPCKAACRDGLYKNGPGACVVQCGTACGTDVSCLTPCFGGCEGKAPDDLTPPHTTVDLGPLVVSSDSSAAFSFSCNEPSCIFACSLDGGAFMECTSPAGYSGLQDGVHSFEVRAYDSALNYDPDPAIWRWTIDTFVPITPPLPPAPSWPVAPSGQAKCYHDADEMPCPVTGQTYYGQDAQYSDGATNFTVNAATVTDVTTGLTWQRQDDGTTRGWAAAAAYCDALALGGYTDWRLPGANELLGLVDFSRYSPAIDPELFPNTKASFYWAQEVSSGSMQAWAVLFSYGYVFSSEKTEDVLYARCVRGVQP